MMGELVQNTPADRVATQRLSHDIVESIRNDEPMPLPLMEVARMLAAGPMFHRNAVESLVAMLCQEIEILVAERDRMRAYETQPCGLGPPDSFLFSDGSPGVGIGEDTCSANEARAYAARLLRAADEAEALAKKDTP